MSKVVYWTERNTFSSGDVSIQVSRTCLDTEFGGRIGKSERNLRTLRNTNSLGCGDVTIPIDIACIKWTLINTEFVSGSFIGERSSGTKLDTFLGAIFTIIVELAHEWSATNLGVIVSISEGRSLMAYSNTNSVYCLGLGVSVSVQTFGFACTGVVATEKSCWVGGVACQYAEPVADVSKVCGRSCGWIDGVCGACAHA